MMEKIARNRLLNLLSGLALLVTSGYETWESFENFSLGAHHGVLVFGLIQILKALQEIMEGTEKLVQAKSAA